MILIHQDIDFFSINESTSDFIDFTGNPFVFMILIAIEYTMRLKSTETKKIQHKIINEFCHFINWRKRRSVRSIIEHLSYYVGGILSKCGSNSEGNVLLFNSMFHA